MVLLPSMNSKISVQSNANKQKSAKVSSPQLCDLNWNELVYSSGYVL